MWLVFYSLRDYGNALAGTKGTQRRQMWVTAIDKSKLGTRVDPSTVPAAAAAVVASHEDQAHATRSEATHDHEVSQSRGHLPVLALRRGHRRSVPLVHSSSSMVHNSRGASLAPC